MPRPHPRSRFPIFLLFPFLFLILSLLCILASAFTEPLPALPLVPPPPESDSLSTLPLTPPTTTSPETQPEESLNESRLPILLSSASDLPPLAAELYDVLFATDPTLPVFPEDTYATPLPKNEVPNGGYAILLKNLSRGEGNALKYISNKTSYQPNLEALAAMPWEGALPVYSEQPNPDQPIVLIYHTHGTECYLPDDTTYLTDQTEFRSTDTSKNMIAVGAVLAKTLNDAGIPTVHCEIMHDKDSYSDAYSNARKTVKAYLAQYPSIRYVLDVHRDAIITANGDHVRPITTVDGKQTAQLMFVVGTDEAGAAHPNWETNLSLACKLQERLTARAPDLMRPINLRSSSFLAQYSSGALLLEIGSAANTLGQAKHAAVLFGRQLAALIRELGTAAPA